MENEKENVSTIIEENLKEKQQQKSILLNQSVCQTNIEDQSVLMKESINLQIEKNESQEFNFLKQREKIILDYTAKIKQIHLNYYEDQILFEDKEFPPLNKFLFQNDEEIQQAKDVFKNWEWLRPQEINKKFCFQDKVNQYNYEIRSGEFSSRNLINAISCLTNEDYYEKVFVDFDNIHMGYVTCQFFKNGQWIYIIVDTLLPYSTHTKKFLFSHNGQNEIFWVALLEKAYAKLHKNYQHIQNLNFEEIMIDICNCHISSIDLKDSSKTSFLESQKLFHYLMNFVKGKEPYFVACINQNEEQKESQMEIGEYGILKNHMHSVISLEDIQKDNLKFLRLRNFWGYETNWSGPYSKNSDELDKYKNLRDLLTKNFSKDPQNVYFIKYEYFIKEFNKIFIIKLFDEKQWQNFSYASKWKKKPITGPPQNLDLKYPINQRFQRSTTQLDSDSTWFNNPQFRIQIFKKTKLYIFLSQHDKNDQGKKNSYEKTNFYLFKNLKGNNRIWEFPNQDKIVLQQKQSIKKEQQDENSKFRKNSQNFEDNDSIVIDINEREISQHITLDVFDGKKTGNYTLCVNLENIKQTEEIPFYLKIFANNNILFEELPKTLEYAFQGQWTNETSGGPYFPLNKPSEINPEWCLNTQYLINFKEPTFLKIILQKTGKNAKKLKNIKLGISYMYLNNNKYLEYYQIKSKKQEQNHKTKKDHNKAKLMKKIQQYLNIPKLEIFQRKIMVQKEEKFVHSTFASSEIACLYLKIQPIEGPLLIVPSLEKPGLICDFKIQFFSNKFIDIKELNQSHNKVIISEWTQYNSGGSHIYNEKFYSNPEKRTWTNNPIFVLKFLDFEGFQPQKHKINIKLNICDEKWKSNLFKKKSGKESFEQKFKQKKNMVNVDCMICLYVMKKQDNLSLENIIYQTPFSPKMEIDYDFYYNLKDFEGKNEILLMPATYSNGIDAQFIISAHCESPIALSKL